MNIENFETIHIQIQNNNLELNVPFDSIKEIMTPNIEDSPLYHMLENMLSTMALQSGNEIYQLLNDDTIQYQIYYEIDDENNINDEENSYFSNCKEINEFLCKPQKIKDNDTLVLNNETCNICCDNYVPGQLKRNIPQCGHCYHKKCIDKWLKKNGSCPICRHNLLKK